MIGCVMLVAVLSWPLSRQAVEVPATAQRIAAVQFAVANGFVVPGENLVVVREVLVQGGRFVSTNVFSEADRVQDARQIARLFGAAVQTGDARD